MRKQYRNKKVQILILALVMLMLTGCEADPTVSTYHRNTAMNMSTINPQEELSADVYTGDVFYDQPTAENESQLLCLNSSEDELSKLDDSTRQKMRKTIDSFVHAWYNYNFSHIKEDDFAEIDGYVTQPMASETFSGAVLHAHMADIINGEAISDITSIDYYDAYTPQLVDNNGNSVARVKVNVIARMAGNDMYFMDNKHLTAGDVCYSLYFYFENTDELKICGIYEVTHPREGTCWYTANGITRSDADISLVGHTSMLDQYVFKKDEVDLSLDEKNKIYASIVSFFNRFFRGGTDDVLYPTQDEPFLKKYGAFIDAIANCQITCDDNYVSYSMEMAYPDVSLYSKDDSDFYIIKESILLNCNADMIDTLLPFEIQDGLWEYTVYLVMSTNDPEHRIIDVEVVPYFGPYGSADDVDAG